MIYTINTCSPAWECALTAGREEDIIHYLRGWAVWHQHQVAVQPRPRRLCALPLSMVCWCLAVQINLLIPSITWLLESSSFSLGFLLRKITAKGGGEWVISLTSPFVLKGELHWFDTSKSVYSSWEVLRHMNKKSVTASCGSRERDWNET